MRLSLRSESDQVGSFVSYNPKTGKELRRFEDASQKDVVESVAQAGEAGKVWGRKTFPERAERLRKLGSLMGRGADALASVVTLEIGKPLQESYGADLLPCLKGIRWLESNAQALLSSRNIQSNIETQAVPFGVVGVIGTWNYPLYLNFAPIIWAVAAGNAVVWKPSELATVTAVALQALFEEAKLPIKMIVGGAETGKFLCNSGFDKLAFTGGIKTGCAILGELAKSGTPSVMELSGNDVMIVCEDADIKVVAKSAVWGRVSNCGQSCVAPQRILVDAKIYPAFLEECEKILKALQPGRDFTLMRTPELARNAQRLVDESVELGAKIVYKFDTQEPWKQAVSPTLLADCDLAMAVFREDFFGPVLATKSFDEIEEAENYVNLHSEMGLGASIWTKNFQNGSEIAARLNVGLVSINEILLDAADPKIPFGGFRGSGFGKLRGAEGLNEFVRWRTVVVHSAGGERRHLFPYNEQTLPILKGLVELEASSGIREKVGAITKLADAARKWKK